MASTRSRSMAFSTTAQPSVRTRSACAAMVASSRVPVSSRTCSDSVLSIVAPVWSAETDAINGATMTLKASGTAP